MFRRNMTLLMLFSGLVLGLYQNCSNNKFDFAAQDSGSSGGALNTGGGTPPPGNGSPTPTPDNGSGPTITPLPMITLAPYVTPIPTKVPLDCKLPRTVSGDSCVCPSDTNWDGANCVTCASGMSWDPVTNKCVSFTAVCKTYVEIINGTNSGTTQTAVQIPARSAAGVCYYVHMIYAYPPASGYPASTVYLHVRNDVLARNHDNITPHPRIISDPAHFVDPTQLALTFKLLGKRQMIVAGDSLGTKSMSVDNFFLAEFFKPAGVSFWGSGTADALLDSSDPTYPGKIIVNYNGKALPVDYFSYQAVGTAIFQPVDLSRYVNFDANGVSEITNVRMSPLDCGGVGGTTDAYLLFR